jgi:predicted nucleotide-binding protein
MKQKEQKTAGKTAEGLRGKIKSDFPKHTLVEALRVASALENRNGGQPLPPTETAIAMDMSPGSSEFRVLLSSSIKYGLTSGSYNSERVALEETGRNIVEPRSEEDAKAAQLTAALNPPTFRSIYNYFKGKKLPEAGFFANTVIREFQIPREHAEKCVSVFVKNMENVGLIRVASTGKWLSTEATIAGGTDGAVVESRAIVPDDDTHDDDTESGVIAADANGSSSSATAPKPAADDQKRLSRVFITHGKNRAFVAPIRDLLTFGQLEAVVSVDRETVSQPVPDKVMNDMRTCGAAIIHVEDEQTLLDSAAQEHAVLNPNVLIEIGAAMALYGRRFILLVKEGVRLPSNLQGLYYVTFKGDALDGDATIKLLKAINELKTHPLPTA